MRLSFGLEIPVPDIEPVQPTSARHVLNSESVSLWSKAPRLDLGTMGCILGPLFRREPSSPRVAELSRDDVDDILRSRGAALLAKFWGGYVALLASSDGTISILRDPSGMMPCYFRRMASRLAIASDMGTLVKPGQTKVDFDSLARMFAGVDMIGRRTGISGVEELLPGEMLIISPDGGIRIEPAWSPWEHVDPQDLMDIDATAHTLRETLWNCIGAWSTCFDNILVGVSGGLDSSIIAAALGSCASNVRLLTMVEPGTDGDERRYARALAELLGRRLDEVSYDLGATDVCKAVLPHLPLPVAAHYFQAIAAEHGRISADWPVGAYFSGNGGDNVLCAMRSAAPLADRFLTTPVSPGLFSTARDLADLTGAGLPKVIHQGISRVRRRHEGHRVVCNFTGLGSAGCAAALAGSDRHPWLSMPAGSLPGKCAHVAMLARAGRSIELYPRETDPPQISPFLSQPVVELCLSIPTWYWVHAGRDRAMARQAFKDVLPALIVERRTKGGPTGFIQRIFAAQRQEAILMLEHGKLVETGLLDREWLRNLSQHSWRDDGRDLRLLSFAAAEAWVRWWEDASDTCR